MVAIENDTVSKWWDLVISEPVTSSSLAWFLYFLIAAHKVRIKDCRSHICPQDSVEK